MKILAFLLFGILSFTDLSYASDSESETHGHLTARTCQEFKGILEQTNRNTLVVWDVDGVLVTPDNILLNPERKRGLKDKFKEASNLLGFHKVKVFYQMIEEKKIPLNYTLVEGAIAGFIEDLQQREVPVIACTGTLLKGGKHGALKELGIELSKPFERDDSSQYKKHFCKTSDGKTRCRGYLSDADKPAVIENFIRDFNKTRQEADKIRNLIFIDDFLRNVKDVTSKVKLFDQVTGIHYRFVDDHISAAELELAYQKLQQ